MPPFPATVNKVMEICRDVNTSPTDLTKVISLDPVLTGKVMQLVNSAYFGLSREIISPVRAVVMLGMNTVKNLVLGATVMSAFGTSKNFRALNMDMFWKHSLGVGVIAKLIAQKRNIDQKLLEGYFIAGLLHDIGKIPLNSKFSDEYRNILGIPEKKPQPLFISEKQLLGIDHAYVGNLIAKKWKLGEEISDTITYHHAPETYQGVQNDILFTVILSDHFANNSEIGYSGNRYFENIYPEVMRYLGDDTEFSFDNISAFNGEVEQEIENAQIFLKIAG
ncbi:MAG: HDOD domain-containing protein [Desulfobacteraceae bacterium]|nr:HDOD domain-containing protein [Desulfobacteraceae bacterium]MDH3573580.1 HDOD domain-containing protein [Desulfobacteraceae bacterium]MDH3721580.1 HDOD domain-containing protein [Desulfobacteraceae bacterium]MDH3873829.1 HDOD domain-containing protein [Desulfobacteraceae bacterium]MDH3956303.1 HDOD domain-containing protein [Desulfobacteraceae bacterium]